MKTISMACCLLAIMVFLSGCPGGGAPAPPPQTANLTISIKNYLSGGTGIQCPASINWRFEPISITGTQGKNSAFDTTGNYTGTSSQIETSGGYPVYGCLYNDNQLGLAAGTWKIKASTAFGQLNVKNSLVTEAVSAIAPNLLLINEDANRKMYE